MWSASHCVGVGLAAEGTVAVVAGVVGVMERAAGGAGEEFAAQRGGAAGEELCEHLALTRGHGGAEPFQVGRSLLAEQVVETDRVSRRPPRDRSPP